MNNDMTQGKILPTLIRFTIPILLGDLFQQFYNIVDSMIVGRVLGASSLAAVGSTGTIMFLVVGFASALGGGFAVVTSQRFGAKDASGLRQSFASSVILMLFFGILSSAITLASMHHILIWMHTPDDIFRDAYAYIMVISVGIPTTVFYNLFASSLRAIGNSRIPLLFLIFSSCLNVVLDLSFLLILHTGVEGAAAATVLSQAISAIFCGIYIFCKEPSLVPRKGEWKPNSAIVKQQLIIGIPMALQNAITASGTMVMQAATNSFGSLAIAATTAAAKGRMIFTQPMMSVGLSIATYCGQNYGKGDMDRVEKGVWTTTKIMTLYSLAVGAFLALALPLELRIFFSGGVSIQELLPYARIYIYECVICFIPLSWIFIFRNAMQGCGGSLLPMSAGFVELASRLITAFLAMHTMNFYIACLCDPAAWLMGGIYTLVCFIITTRRLRRKLGTN